MHACACVQSREQMGPGVCRVGRMEIGPEILGYGSGGTLVFEGTLDGRPIAVKRLLGQVACPAAADCLVVLGSLCGPAPRLLGRHLRVPVVQSTYFSWPIFLLQEEGFRGGALLASCCEHPAALGSWRAACT